MREVFVLVTGTVVEGVRAEIGEITFENAILGQKIANGEDFFVKDAKINGNITISAFFIPTSAILAEGQGQTGFYAASI